VAWTAAQTQHHSNPLAGSHNLFLFIASSWMRYLPESFFDAFNLRYVISNVALFLTTNGLSLGCPLPAGHHGHHRFDPV
jgi:hypothetical protein